MQTSHSLCWDKAVTQTSKKGHFPDLTVSVMDNCIEPSEHSLNGIFVYNQVLEMMTKQSDNNDDSAFLYCCLFYQVYNGISFYFSWTVSQIK